MDCTLSPLNSLDHIRGTKTTRRLVAALLPKVDRYGLATVKRAELARLLRVAEGTVRLLVRGLEKFGFLVRYGRNFVFRLTSKVTQQPRREDPETEAQALAAFADGRRRAGAETRRADPSAAPVVLEHARTLESGELRGVDLMQIARLLGESYVRDAATDTLRRENFPIHPRFLMPARDAMERGVKLRLAQERHAAELRRSDQAAARERTQPESPEARAERLRALELIGALGGA